MSTTERDARALTYLARRLREDTHGAGKWDEPGVWAEVSALIGQNLAIAIERVTRHAADPEAKTPGAIRRPYVPGPPAPVMERNIAPVGSRCTVCGEVETRCRQLWAGDHEFTRPIPRDVDLTPVITEVKSHRKPMRPRTEPTPPPNPEVSAAREAPHEEASA
jgi:hypothetical protein